MVTPHDDLFHFTFRHPAQVVPWLQFVLPQEVANEIDWDSLQPAPEKLRSEGLRLSVADLVFTAGCRGTHGPVWIVVEHKAHRDVGVQEQLLRYCMLLRDQPPRPGAEPPVPVVPILLHHGHRPLAHAVPGEGDAFAALQPRVPIVVDDLSRASEADIRARPMRPLGLLTQLCLWSLRGMSGEAVLQAFCRWGDLLRAVDRDQGPPSGHAAIRAIGCYTLMVVEVAHRDLHSTFERLLERREETIMSTAERLRREGMEAGLAKGLTQGRTEGRMEVLMRQLTRRFGGLAPDTVARIRGASVAELDRWADRVLDAASVAEVFDD